MTGPPGDADATGRRELSSGATFLFKVVGSIVWFGLGGVAIVLSLAIGEYSIVPFGIAWLIATILVYVSCVRLKEVDVDDSNLYISGSTSQITVPLADVESVTHSPMIRRAFITFNHKTEFGRRIIFIPKTGRRDVDVPHATVKELAKLVSKARSARGPEDRTHAE